MPTYEYRCHACQRLSDAFQKMTDAALIVCPYCGKPELERIVSGGAGVIYKGEGWYVTDYSKKSTGGKESVPQETPAKTESTTADKPETPKAKPTPEKSTPSANG